MREKIQAIEAQMLTEVRQIVADNRDILHVLDPAVRLQICSILRYGPLSTDAWLVTPCSYLDAQRPIDVLSVDQERVFAAAKHRKQGTRHG